MHRQENGHPTSFPLELATRLVKIFSFVGDTVLDSFCGSGITMIVAINSQRSSIGVETESFYCDHILNHIDNEYGMFKNFELSYTYLTNEKDKY